MSERESRGLFSKPTLGGWLTMLNAVGWVAFVAIARFGQIPDFIAMTFVVVFGLPLGCLCLMPGVGASFGRIPSVIAFGCNSFIWGYTIAAMYSAFRGSPKPKRANKRELTVCVECGEKYHAETEQVCPVCGEA